MNKSIREKLFALQDKNYTEFSAKLVPSLPKDIFIGVRVPQIRKLAKQIANTQEAEKFLQTLPHQYYDENMLHAILISEIKDYDTCIETINSFLPYVDNWAVCDVMSPKIFRRHRAELITQIKKWIASNKLYTCRFGLEMLMSHFLDENFKTEYLQLASEVQSDEYYLQMMLAWFFATALAKQWGSTIIYIEQNKLSKWVHNKTIQKARESYRITAEQKNYLKTLRQI